LLREEGGNMENIIGIITVCINLLIGGGAIITNIIIASRTIKANKEIAKENAGKNRVIYSIEEVEIDATSPKSKIGLNEKLNSGNYAILTTYTFHGNHNIRIYSLGKIKL